MRKTAGRLGALALVLVAATACGFDTSATFNADGSVTVGLKFLAPKSLLQGTNGASVSGLSPADIARANAGIQSKYPGGKVTVVTEGDQSGALVTIPFKTEKDAFAFLTQPSTINPSGASSGTKVGLNLADTGGLFTSASHTTSGATDTYTFKTAPRPQPSPSPGEQQVISEDELASIFEITFALTVPHVITSAPGALFTLDRKTAIWKLNWTRAETLTATTGPDSAASLVASVTPAGQDLRMVAAVGFTAIAVGFLLGMLLTWRGLLPRREQRATAPLAAGKADLPASVPEPAQAWPGPPPGAPPPS